MEYSGSPPLAWGILFLIVLLLTLLRITPTCVGNTLVSTYNIALKRDHPHLRGEYTGIL